MEDLKPLPAIPKSSNLTDLTVEAHAHRSRFIRHVLSETQDPWFDGWKEAWAISLEAALDQLGESISQGEWLADIKRGRKLRRTKRDVEKHQTDVKKRRTQESSTGKKKTSISASDSQETTEQGRENVEAKTTDGESSESQRESDTSLALKQIKEIASKPTSQSQTDATASHLLLCVAPVGSPSALPTEDSGFDLIPANVGCAFTAGVFFLPDGDSDTTSAGNVFLYGFNEWDVHTENLIDDSVGLVGGTFTFQGVNSPLQHHTLFKALKLSVYVYLSLLLEQHFLANSGVHLNFPEAPIMTPSSPQAPPLDRKQSDSVSKAKHVNHFLPTGILSFFSKKNLIHRTRSVSPMLGRRGSLDISKPSQDQKDEQGQRSSEEGSLRRLRRFSLRSDSRSSFLKSSQPKAEPEPPFASVLKQIEGSKDLLSSSAGVSFAPPSLIVHLAEKEKANPTRRLKGDEKTGLSSIIGWDGKDAGGTGMSGTLGFIRQQEFSLLYSKHVPSTLPLPLPSKSSEPSESSISSLESSKSKFLLCDRPRWITYRYYSHNPEEDKSLGEMIIDLSSKSHLACDKLGCQFKRGEHELRFIHAGVRISVKVDGPAEGEVICDDDEIKVWQSCAVCGAKTEESEIGEGAYLFSLSKFLELLVYSPALCTLTPALCEHTDPPPHPWSEADSPLPRSRLNIIWNFSCRSCTVSFSRSVIEDIFELRVPRLQIVRNHGDKYARSSVDSDTCVDGDGDEEKKALRGEIKLWWEGVANHIEKLEEELSKDHLAVHEKALPRPPSSDDAHDEIDSQATPKAGVTVLPPLPPSTPDTPSTPDGRKEHLQRPFAPHSDSSPPPPTPRKQADPAHLLSKLRHTFQRTEQSLYTLLSSTPVSSLNDVRRAFQSAARGASRRLQAWQDKHLPAMVKAHLIEQLSCEEPEWWGKSCHPLPGGNVIVRENDWGSIIAFTMSTVDYQRELANMSASRSPSATQSITSSSSPVSTSPSFFSAAAGYKLFASSAHKQPDPDQEDVIWHEPETYSAVISRKEHPRDPTSLLSLREVLRQKSPVDDPTGLPTSRFGSLGSSAAKATGGAPPSAWAKPDVQMSMQAAGGEVTGLRESVDSAGKILHELESGSTESSHASSAMSESFTSSSGFGDAHIRRGKASSIISAESDATVSPEHGTTELATPPVPPPKDDIHTYGQKDNVESQTASAKTNKTASSLTNTVTSGITNAMRFMLNNSEQPSPSAASKGHHGLLSAETSIDERPHIKYDWTVGKRLKFSCTVYYAKQFDTLRRRCGVGNVFLRSLSRSANWAAEGGKSKSNFWKTADDRFIIKTLVNAWNVADLQVLIELAPSYFRYMEATANKATVLAKLIGFYTIEIRNLESGTVQAKTDLLVMENLFYKQKTVKTFDLKGIQGRKVKAGTHSAGGAQNSKTLFDGEWIEGQQQTLTLVRPHSKVILREAIKNDADFLSKCNIMDYSLLLGVDEERKQIACGLVDTIGSYTFAKTLEYKAKHGLNAGKDVTVVPPAEYQERFVNTLEGYFLACPDKWSKSSDDGRIMNDPTSLPSVL